jgi:hypothetical protein
VNASMSVARIPGAGACPSRLLAGAALALTLVLSLPVRVLADEVHAEIPTLHPGVLQTPVPPFVPPGKKLVGLSKDAFGAAGQGQVAVKVCHNQVTEEINGLTVTFKLLPGPCDEECSKTDLNGILVCTVNVLRRKPDLRGCFSGRWYLTLPNGGILAFGTLDGTVGCGTHRGPGTAPCEECHEPKHFEGRLEGRVLRGKCEGATLCATLAGTGPLQPSTAQQMTIEGIVITNCAP